MHLLRVTANNFKNCAKNFTIDFVAKSKKTSEDKEYELLEIAEDLFLCNTTAFIGKNASGKTTAIELLDCCYSILNDFHLENKTYSYENIALTLFFFHEGFIYKYSTTLLDSNSYTSKATFTNQVLLCKPYYKTNVKEIFLDKDFAPVQNIGALPEDTSIVFFVLKKKENHAVYFNCMGEGIDTYQLLFKTLQKYKISTQTLFSILKVFDENITSLSMVDDHNYTLCYQSEQKTCSDKELIYLLSSGTTKGLLLYTFMVASLQNGFSLLIDEIENHFHKTLVENMISLYKDQSVNKYQASLMFTTHYCELLDLFNRQDNIWITKAEKNVTIQSMYDGFRMRPELLKSKQFYNNTFETAVNYDSLMQLKKELML